MAESSTRQAQASDDLERRLSELERRVSALEGNVRSTVESPLDAPTAFPAASGLAIATTPAGAAAVLGQALLAIAGAYLLRALTEWAVLPRPMGVIAGLIYAGYWLVSSARLPAGDSLGAAVRALTAVAILAPMLWETTVRFAALTSHGAATTLGAFVALALALTWTRDLPPIRRITTCAAVAASIALIIGTQDVTPFLIVALAMAALVEYAAIRSRWLDVRWLVAAGADLTTALMLYLMNRPHGLPRGYAPIPPSLEILAPAALAAIYIGSTVTRTLVHGENICWFEGGQVAVSIGLFLAAALGAHGGGAGHVIAGALCAALGAACYAAGYLFLDRRAGQNRSFYVYVNFALALTISATLILTSHIALAATLGLLAVGATIAGIRAERVTLRVHGAVYLLTAALASGLFVRTGERLLSRGTAAWTGVAGDALTVVAAAAACYAAVVVLRAGGGLWVGRALDVLIAAMLCWSATGLIAGGVIGAIGAGADDSVTASIRTVVACAGLILIAWVGGRFRLGELSWIVYPAIAMVAVKLLIEDVYLGRPVTIFTSLLAYSAVLILAPKLARRTSDGAAASESRP